MRPDLIDGWTKVNILGVNVHSIPLAGLIQFILQSCNNHRKVIVSYVNVHATNLAYMMDKFRNFFNHSDIVFCDGYGVKLAAELIQDTRLYRYTPPDWFPVLSKECAHQGISMYFLGAKPGVAERAALKLTSEIPDLKIAGVHDGYFDKGSQSEEQLAIIDEINRLQPNILVVGFGMPLQEQWIQENYNMLNVNVFLTVGAFFDYLAGEVVRVPRWMTDHGLEWLGRLIIEPRRLWKRYLLGNPLFFWRIFKHHILGLPLPYT